MNKHKLFKPFLAMSALFVVFAVPTESQATAGYSRQTGSACATCHFQHYPALNSTGREFKAGGYTLMGKQGLIDGENLSLPEILNAGLVMKARYQETNGTTVGGTHNTNNGQLQLFDEMLLMLGGRISKNIGVQVELNLLAEDDPVLENFKMPFVYDVGGVKAGVVIFTTASQGVAYGFELLNTGAVRGQRIMEHRTDMSAQQYIGTGSAAEGFAAIAYTPLFFANLSKWSPRSVGDASGDPDANYVRLAVTPRAGSWDLGAGVQWWSGSAEVGAAGNERDTEAWAVDAQAQGAIGNLPLGIYLSYANAKGTKVGDTINFFNSNPNDETATAIAAELGVLPRKATLLLAYRMGDNGKATNNEDNSWTLGGTYQIVQNIQFQLNYSKRSGSAYDTVPAPANGDQLLTLMLFGAF
jgi:predicted porin